MSEPNPGTWRPMTAYERALLSHLLSRDSRGREAAWAQAASALVRSIDEDGCIEFGAPMGPDIQAPHPFLAQGFGARDAEGTPIDVILHAEKGRLHCLEFVRYGNDATTLPDPAQLEVFAVDEDGQHRDASGRRPGEY